MELFASALEGVSTWVVSSIYTVVLWEIWCRIGWPRIVGDHGRNNVRTEHPQNAADDSGYNSDESNGQLQPHTIPQQPLQDRLDAFVDASNYALQSAYPKPQATGSPRYSKVSVLLIQWEEDDLGVSTELNKLYEVFEADYGYDCEDIFKIPERDSQVALMTRLQRLIDNASRDHLLIIYYGGHSDDSSSQQSIWISHNSRSASSVNWSLNQAFLLQCPSDVLMILDTCYAAKGGSNTAGPTKGANEVIAATNEVIEAPGVSRLSFTSVLVRVLKNFAEKHRTENLQLSAVWLCTHMRNYYYDQELRKPPYYVSLVNYRFESCRIVPRPYSRNRFLGRYSPLMPPDLGPFRVTVAIHLKESPSGDLVSWLQGQGAPAGYIDGVELINIQAAYLANSSLLLITLPPAVWLLLPPEIPCTFLGLTRSGNLLAEEKGSATAKITTGKTSPSSNEQIIALNPPSSYENKAFLMVEEMFNKLQLRRQNEYWIDRVSGSARYRPSLIQCGYRRLALNEFRLLELLPGQENDTLNGRLITVDPTSAPQYVALSYVWAGRPWEKWGGPPFILEDDVAVELKPSLDSAMRALRRLDQNIHIWIDALCIDQDNDMEKDMQIPLMADICRLSDSVAVWLGEATSSGQVAFSFATWISKHPDLVVNVPEEQLRMLIETFSRMILNRWFRTKWAIATFVMAKEVNLHYGKDVLPWRIMARAVYVLRYRALDLLQLFLHKENLADNFLEFLADFKYHGVNDFVDLRDDMQRKLANPLRIDPRIRLDGLVTRTALLDAGKNKDAVYSMVSLVSERKLLSSNVKSTSPVRSAASHPETLLDPPSKKALLSLSAEVPLRSLSAEVPLRTLSSGNPYEDDLPPVDYDLSRQKVYCDFVRYTIRSTRQLDIICRPWAPEVPDLPSWVRPRSDHAFRVLDDNRYCRVNADGLAVSSSTYQTLYSACGKDFRLEEDDVYLPTYEGASLAVEGWRLGIVDVLALPAENGILPKEWRKIGERSNKGKVSDDWFWRTLVADRDSTGLACPAWFKLASDHVLQNSDGVDLDTRRLMFESSPGMVFDFLRRVQSVIWGRRLAILNQGYVVLGPRSMEAGDSVCILFGCSVPLVVRPRRDGMGHTFVGECYVHGMMDGEARILEEQGKLHTRSFTLY